jgi:hypothetical protein
MATSFKSPMRPWWGSFLWVATVNLKTVSLAITSPALLVGMIAAAHCTKPGLSLLPFCPLLMNLTIYTLKPRYNNLFNNKIPAMKNLILSPSVINFISKKPL